MATYSFEGPDGRTYDFDGPDETPKRTVGSALKEGYDLLNKPSEMSREGLNQMAGFLPEVGKTKSAALNFAWGAPRAAAETVAEIAPTFIDAPSILTAGASKVAGKVLPYVGKGLAQFGHLSGATPEVLETIAKNPGSLFTKGEEAVGDMYKAAKEATPFAKTARNPKVYINKMEELAKQNLLTPSEALEARKEVSRLFESKAITGERQRYLRGVFGDVVKSDSKLKAADEAMTRLKSVEKARSILPLSASGKPSTIRSSAMAAMGGASFLNPAFLAAVPAFSPAVQGITAALLGAGHQLASSPKAAVYAKNLIQALLKKEEK